MDKLIITVNPAGGPEMRNARTQAQACIEAFNAGASIAHIHGNMLPPEAGYRQPELDHWGEMTEYIRAGSDLIVQFGVAVMNPETRGRLLDLKPDMGSFLLGMHDIVTANGPLYHLSTLEDQKESARYHLEKGVMPECEVWHLGNVWNMNQLIQAGLLVPPYYTTVFFRSQGGHASPQTPQELLHRVEHLPPGTIWCVSSSGRAQIGLHALAIIQGGHLRTGFEDERNLHPGVPAKSNAELVERIVRLARDLGREVATPAEAREILGIPRPPQPLAA